jgi:hypothetical protein
MCEKDAVCLKSSGVRDLIDILEVSYVFHRNDVGRLQTVTVDIKENGGPDTSPVKH